MIETLETRRLCSAAVRHSRPVYFVDDAYTLNISGSVGNDSIVVSGNRRRVTLNLNGKTVVLTQPIRRAVIYGGRGEDLIECGAGYIDAKEDTTIDWLYIPVYADGGIGRDTLNSGVPGSTLFGGSGNDRLLGMEYGYSKNVYLDGGPGDDVLKFGEVMHGGSGDDEATNDGFYDLGITFMSGMERQYELSNYSSSVYKTDLKTSDGQLVLSYTSDGDSERSITTPYLRDEDGRIGLTVIYDYPPDAANPAPPQTKWTVPFSARRTALALSHGIVIKFVDSNGKPSRAEQLVLIPAQN